MTPYLLELDTGWIEQGLLKHRAQYSPILVFETTDPKRLWQLRAYLRNHPELRGYDYAFVFDPWDGLGKLGGTPRDPTIEPYRKTVGSSALAQKLHPEGQTLTATKAVLKEIDPYLKKWRTLFILQNLSENREQETGLLACLRAWAIDPQIATRHSVVMLLTADADAILDEFTKELVVVIEVDPSSPEDREKIITNTARELELRLEPDARYELVVATAGLNLHQLESILLESYHATRGFDLGTIKALKSALVKQSGVLEVSDPKYSFADIGGYDAIKDFIRKYIINVLRHAERARRFGLPLPKGLLFFGPPGTGKSLFANALATEIRLPFINLVTENIYSKWLGESGQRMKSAIRLAEKMSPAIVFVDEIDRFGRRAAGGGDSAGEETRRVFSQFLEWLGKPDREAIIVGTTNVPDHLDEAFLRTGRFDYKIPFLYPGEAARLDVLRVHLGLKSASKPRPPLELDEAELLDFLRDEVVPATRFFSCAELEELVVRSKRVAFDRGADAIGRVDFLQAARSFRVDQDQRARTVERYIRHARQFTDDQTFLDAVEDDLEVKV